MKKTIGAGALLVSLLIVLLTALPAASIRCRQAVFSPQALPMTTK
jgi:hypothetical protein